MIRPGAGASNLGRVPRAVGGSGRVGPARRAGRSAVCRAAGPARRPRPWRASSAALRRLGFAGGLAVGLAGLGAASSRLGAVAAARRPRLGASRSAPRSGSSGCLRGRRSAAPRPGGQPRRAGAGAAGGLGAVGSRRSARARLGVGVGSAVASGSAAAARPPRRRGVGIVGAGPRPGAREPRCAAASYSRIEPATAALSESIRPCIGIRTSRSQRRRTAGPEALALAADDDRDRARAGPPRARSAARRRRRRRSAGRARGGRRARPGRSSTGARRRCSTAPADALIAAGVSGAWWRVGKTAPWTPVASAVRSSVPTFWGSSSESSTSTSGGSPRWRRARGPRRATAQRRGATTSAIPWWPSNPATAVSVPPSTSTTGIRRLVAWRTSFSSACAPLRDDEQAPGLAAGDERLLDRAAAGDELLVLGERRRSGGGGSSGRAGGPNRRPGGPNPRSKRAGRTVEGPRRAVDGARRAGVERRGPRSSRPVRAIRAAGPSGSAPVRPVVGPPVAGRPDASCRRDADRGPGPPARPIATGPPRPPGPPGAAAGSVRAGARRGPEPPGPPPARGRVRPPRGRPRRPGRRPVAIPRTRARVRAPAAGRSPRPVVAARDGPAPRAAGRRSHGRRGPPRGPPPPRSARTGRIVAIAVARPPIRLGLGVAADARTVLGRAARHPRRPGAAGLRPPGPRLAPPGRRMGRRPPCRALRARRPLRRSASSPGRRPVSHRRSPGAASAGRRGCPRPRRPRRQQLVAQPVGRRPVARRARGGARVEQRLELRLERRARPARRRPSTASSSRISAAARAGVGRRQRAARRSAG